MRVRIARHFHVRFTPLGSSKPNPFAARLRTQIATATVLRTRTEVVSVPMRFPDLGRTLHDFWPMRSLLPQPAVGTSTHLAAVLLSVTTLRRARSSTSRSENFTATLRPAHKYHHARSCGGYTTAAVDLISQHLANPTPSRRYPRSLSRPRGFRSFTSRLRYRGVSPLDFPHRQANWVLQTDKNLASLGFCC
jgi:hypothetical protein